MNYRVCRWLILPAMLLALAGCEGNHQIPAKGRQFADSTPEDESDVLPAAPPIYAKGIALQQANHAERIGVPLAMAEEQIVGNMEEPLWKYSDLFDNPKIAKAIVIALRSNEDGDVMEIGGERASLLVSRLRLLNASLFDLTRAGILAPEIHSVYSGREFRAQIGSRERGICAALSAYPEISPAYAAWISKIGDAAEPKGAR